ncbi:MAG TPA: NYN domain-containing protein [Candidatus Paceibacterota bacterium]|nr:NYN domain-containing protein [Candidatus Paceibacterota bacterium]
MSIIKHKEQRVGVFIDTSNLYHSAKNLYKRKVNFGAVLKDAVAGRKLVRAIAYVITSEGGEEKNFFDALTKLGIETKTKELQIFAGGAKKGDWDVGMSVDAMKMAPKLDAVILIAGDGDFIPLVEYLQSTSGVQVEVVSFGKSASMRLKEQADDFLDLSNNYRKYLIY